MIRTYRYLLRAPIEGASLVDAQIRLAHHYQNDLVEIERERRAEVRQLFDECLPLASEVQMLVDALEVVRGTVSAARKKAGKRVEVEGSTDRIQTLLAALRDARAQLKEEKRALAKDPECKDRLKEISERAKVACRTLRAAYSDKGLYWGTYLIVEQAMDAARASQTDPHFRRWTGSGAVAVQLQKGLAVDRLLQGSDRRLKVDLRPRPVNTPKRARGKVKELPTISLRIGSVGRDPVWATWPLCYTERRPGQLAHGHPLPENGTVKWAKVVRRRRAGQDHWHVVLTMEEPDGAPACGKGVVAVDLGWRKLDGAIRVGYAMDEEGRGGQMRLLLEWLPSHMESVPAVLTERMKTLAQWRSPARFGALVTAWAENRFEHDSPMFDRLSCWNVQDRRQWKEETGLRRRAQNARKDLYRRWAADLAREYRTLVLEQFDLREVASRPKPEEESDANRTARYNRTVAAVSELRACLEWAFRSRGGEVIHVDAQWTTIDCAQCGKRTTWDPAEAIEHRCAACGAIWDQDRNACFNLLSRYRERSGGAARVKRSVSRSERLAAGRRKSARKGVSKSSSG